AMGKMIRLAMEVAACWVRASAPTGSPMDMNASVPQTTTGWPSTRRRSAGARSTGWWQWRGRPVGSAGAAGPPPAQLVRVAAPGGLRRPIRRLVGLLGGQFGQGPVDLLPDAAERDTEHALPALQQVHHLVGGGALVHGDAVAHQGDLGQVVGAPAAQ